MSELILTNKNFEKEVLNSKEPVLVDFFATWCGPCQMLSPIIKEIADEYKNEIKVGKVNVDEENELAGKYHIFSIPTLIFFKDGEVIKTITGLHSKEEIESIIAKLNK